MNDFFEVLDATDKARQIGVLATDSPAGAAFASHSHAQAQLILAIDGVVIVRADDGNWIVPPGRAVWVPGGTPHAIEMAADVSMCSLFVAHEVRQTLPRECRVIGVSALLRELILTARGLPADYDLTHRAGRVLALILDEIEIAPSLALHVPMPRHPALSALCAQLIREPSAPVTLESWAHAAHMNARTLARAFKRETGMTPGAWWRHARLLLSLPRLAAGMSVLELALEHGYESPSAFAAMFRKVLGVPPTEYLRKG
ncbi:AraC family transcriptional regulator [Pararobbsia silviterrae]|uniref:AraC family transcriptional regulator n=1 Tax=Pararobbsia silviterrae TaxID=1792498 RepID=A0A494XVA4_9BURK|nr:helix-turn-helix transcriptional regulator [Pararobbsia silviterrae]RKP53653.1 AraC family transcriptional regulator [Pararobbsia silviterrae]